jgi:hypothetical protein
LNVVIYNTQKLFKSRNYYDGKLIVFVGDGVLAKASSQFAATKTTGFIKPESLKSNKLEQSFHASIQFVIPSMVDESNADKFIYDCSLLYKTLSLLSSSCILLDILKSGILLLIYIHDYISVVQKVYINI